ncbi:MAG: 2-oxo acid dehydrogenase subunit E2 [Fimbriimonadaceae bacterium]|nr:2-oxo acid dehydrogenase subunit E2 [Fimbriimonadaceae bacterium]
MPEITLNIPSIGEGLQEARVVALLKQPGEEIRRDEAIYQMETDKAVMDVESSVSGRVVRWLAAPDDVLSIGAPILVVESAEEGASAEPATETAPVVAASGTTDGVVSLRIPSIGEGLQEARVVALLKNPGDQVKRDDVIYQMETDKAVMDVECPYEGVVVEWLAKVDDVLSIGAEVMRFQTSEVVAGGDVSSPAPAASAAPTQSAAPVATGGRRRDVPPRTRAYAKEKGVSYDQLETIPASGSKLMPADVDAFLSGGAVATPTAKAGKSSSGKSYSEQPMGGKQRVLSSRLQRGNQLVVPGMMSVVANWGEIESLRDEQKAAGGDFQPSSFTYFAYAVAKAAADHPIMRSTMVGDSNIRTYDHIQLGIAVALPGDELVVAVVENADTLDWKTFATNVRSQINLARDGKDQADESVTLSITNMQGHGIREAMAVVVPPGVATIFLGEVYNGLANDEPGKLTVQRCANIGITIDHRLINGVGGAEFLNAIKSNVEGIRQLVNS